MTKFVLTNFSILLLFSHVLTETLTVFDTLSSRLEKLTRENYAGYNNHKENLERITTAIVAVQERINRTVENIINEHDMKVISLGADGASVELDFCKSSNYYFDKYVEDFLFNTTTCTNNVTTMAEKKYINTIILYEKIGKSLNRITKAYNTCILTFGKKGVSSLSSTAFTNCLKPVSKSVYRIEERIESYKMFVPNSGFDSFNNEQSALENCDATEIFPFLRSKADAFYLEIQACMIYGSTIERSPIISIT